MASYIVTGANGDIGISIAGLLKEHDPDARVIGTDISSQWPALGAGFDEVEIIPKASGFDYVGALDHLVEKYGARFVIPTSEPELRWIASHFGESKHLPLLMNDPELILTCMDKLESIKWLHSIGAPAPQTKDLPEACVENVPFIVKPRFGAGSRGIEIVSSNADFEKIKSLGNNTPMVAQEYLDAENQEYTCVIVKLKNDFRTFIMHRKLTYGVTMEMCGVENAAISDVLNNIAGHLPSYSDINVQLRVTEQGPKIFEINPRFSSTVKMRHMIGFSDFLWLLQSKTEGYSFPDGKPVMGKKVYRIYKEIIGA